MEENNEQIKNSVHPAAAEEELGTAEENISLKKFKSVSALLEAYNSLEAEFTRRCQRIKELEGKIELAETENKSLKTTDSESEVLNISEENKKEIVKEYLKNLLLQKEEAVVIDARGVSVKAPPKKPKTINEAGKMAKEILTKKGK